MKCEDGWISRSETGKFVKYAICTEMYKTNKGQLHLGSLICCHSNVC